MTTAIPGTTQGEAAGTETNHGLAAGPDAPCLPDTEPRASKNTAPTRPGGSNRPRLGFLGVGWIGRHRMQSIAQSGCARIQAIADPQEELARATARELHVTAFDSLEGLLTADLDGVVIATPSALHCEQAVRALDNGLAVFCQKPLGRTTEETTRAIQAARQADVLLGVDLSYRFTSGARKIHQLCREGELGEVYAVDLAFHNAYGPDKAWFYDARLSGGGCVIDLGIHLVDLALWNLGFPGVERVSSRLFSKGKPWSARDGAVEDYAEAQISLDNGTVVRLACSWNLPAGCDAVISCSFYGTKGGASFHNVNGSFFDFESEWLRGRTRQMLTTGPEEWGGRAAVDWAHRLATGAKFDPEIETLSQVAAVLDAIYAPGAMQGPGNIAGEL